MQNVRSIGASHTVQDLLTGVQVLNLGSVIKENHDNQEHNKMRETWQKFEI